MIKISTIRKQRRTGGTRRNTLGIDIGTGAIKMARMVWQDECWAVGNQLILPIPTMPRDFPQEIQDGLLGEQLKPLQHRPLAQKHACACVLPMSLTDLRSVDVPPGSESDVEQMALESLKDLYYPDDFNDRITRLWRQNEASHDLAHVASLSLPDVLAVRVVEQLSAARLNCGAINGLPFALARAADMSPIGRHNQPMALLDWGHTSVTFVISRMGHPEFVRTFRNCGGHRSIDAIAEGLGLTHSDALNVLTTFGLPGDRAAAVSQTVHSLIAQELQRIGGELRKTLLYLQHHVSSLMPSQLVLFGGMATVPNVATAIQAHSDVETSVFSLTGEHGNKSDPLYAVAMAASVGELSS